MHQQDAARAHPADAESRVQVAARDDCPGARQALALALVCPRATGCGFLEVDRPAGPRKPSMAVRGTQPGDRVATPPRGPGRPPWASAVILASIIRAVYYAPRWTPPPSSAAPRERAFLEELQGSGRPELFVLYGRRRVGKTELLQQFCQGQRAVYFLAAQVRDKDNLRAFRDALAEGLGDAAGRRRRVPRLGRRAGLPGRARRRTSAWWSCSTSSPTCARRTRACRRSCSASGTRAARRAR